MNRRVRFRTLPLLLTVLLAVGLLAGCSGTTDSWGDPENGLTLTYRLAEGESLQYQTVSGFDETVRVQGRSMGMTSLTTSDLTMTFGGDAVIPEDPTAPEATIGIVPEADRAAAEDAAAAAEGGFYFTVTVDGMHSTVNAMGRELPRDVGEVIGKQFYMALSPQGTPLAISVGDLQYRVGPFGFRTLDTDFQDFFPILNDGPVKAGDTWLATVEVTDTRDAEMMMVLSYENTLEDVVMVGDLSCARVASRVTGRLSGKAEGPGQDIAFTGEINGSGSWLFAYKEGLLVSRETHINVTGQATDVRAQGGRGMNVPMSRKITNKIQLVR